MPSDVQISKALAFWLRHNPQAGGISVDPAGWADVPSVLQALDREFGVLISLYRLEHVVYTSEKQRFAMVGGRIRANQGHSIAVDLGLQVVIPPDKLYHGTTRESYGHIVVDGALKPMSRNHVHLSPDLDTAYRVALRHGGEPVILEVNAAAMYRDRHSFYRSENGVFLVSGVPSRFIRMMDDREP